MSNSNIPSGPVSLSILGLQAQANTLFEEAGGKSAIELLDKLSALEPKEQEQALKIMSGLLDRLINGETRANTSDSAAKQFEDELYNDLISSLCVADSPIPLANSRLKLEVLKGGPKQEPQRARVINLAELRKSRSSAKVSSPA